MSVAVTAVPASGTHKDVFRFDITGAAKNDSGAADLTKYPVQAELRYYVAYEKGGTEYGRSQVFGVTPDGAFQIYDYIFPSTGSWTVNLRKVSDDSSVATASVTIS